MTVLRDTPSGDAEIVSFELCGPPFMAISAGPLVTFNPSVSFDVAALQRAFDGTEAPVGG